MPVLASLVFITNINASTHTNTNMKVGPERPQHNAKTEYEHKQNMGESNIMALV